jgi:hypothetical protein
MYMRLFSLFSIGIMSLALALGLDGHAPQQALAQDPRADTVAIISNPTQGQVVTGAVQIIGSASHPTLYAGYELEFDSLSDANEIWIPITQRVLQPINNNILGIWDTAGNLRVPDGSYQIRLRVFLSDGSEPVAFVVRDVVITNTAPTPLPSLPPDLPTPTPPDQIGGETSPTPLVIQPPTSTPRASNALGSVNNPPAGGDNTEFTLNFDRLQNAFCEGSIVAFAFFALLAGYLWLRERIRPIVRRALWQIRNELDQDR